MLDTFVSTYITLFFLLTPFFVISTFLSMTAAMDTRQRKRIAMRTILAIIFFALGIYIFGNQVFRVLGITVDSFRIGAGALLFLSSVSLVVGTGDHRPIGEDEDIAVVPLAMPVTVGPGTTGALLVLGADVSRGGLAERIVPVAAVLAAVLSVGAMLYIAARLGRLLSPRIMSVLTKLTGLVLASLAAQLIFTGIRSFLR